MVCCIFCNCRYEAIVKKLLAFRDGYRPEQAQKGVHIPENRDMTTRCHRPKDCISWPFDVI
jgi:hypothetical protein